MLNFQAVLTNVKFDIDCRNVLYFDNREAQENYFSVASLFSSAQPINFNAGSLIETTIIYQVQENESINDILSKNYCIIKDNNANATLKYYYYFVKNSIQDSGNQVKVWLEMDIFQTYFIDIEFSDCEILKAHLNRFVDNGDGSVSFDGSLESNLFEREDIKDVAKRLAKRSKVNIYKSNAYLPGVDTEGISNWLNDNVVAWCYIFLDPIHKYKLFQNSQQVEYKLPSLLYKKGENYIDSQMTVCVFPLSKKPITVNGRVWDYTSLQTFLQNNNDYEYVKTVKLSTMPPFFYIKDANYPGMYWGSNPAIVNDTLTLMFDDVSEGVGIPIADSFKNLYAIYNELQVGSIPANASILIAMSFQGEDIIANEITLDKKLTFPKTEIVGAIKNSKFNPKLLNSDYFDLKIKTTTSEGFIYDLQKLNTNSLKLSLIEPLSPDITRSFLFLKDLQGVYTNAISKSFIGDVDTFDGSLTFASSAYQKMLAENKNFYLQNSMRRTETLAKGLLSGFGSVLSGNFIGAGISMSQNLSNVGFSKIQENLAVDNLKNAPSSINVAKGNSILSVQNEDLGVYCEEWSILPYEAEIANDYMCQFGFTVNTIGNVKDFANIRKYYNYIEADIQETGGIPISKTVHEKFKEMFARGVRFWNNDSFSYELENYEKWLEA